MLVFWKLLPYILFCRVILHGDGEKWPPVNFIMELSNKESSICLMAHILEKIVLSYREHVEHTFIVSPSENGFENCIDKPLSTFPRMSLAAKAVATPAYEI